MDCVVRVGPRHLLDPVEELVRIGVHTDFADVLLALGGQHLEANEECVFECLEVRPKPANDQSVQNVKTSIKAKARGSTTRQQ